MFDLELDEFQERLLDVDWQPANESVRVKYVTDLDETYVLACSKSRMAKECAMRKRKLRAYFLAAGRRQGQCGEFPVSF